MFRVLLVLGAMTGGCAASGEDSVEPELPPEDTSPARDSTFDTFFVDTAITDTGFDGEPEHLLTITWAATWEMSPRNGPYTTMTGSLTLTETLDGDDLKPVSILEYALTGQEAEEGCAGCTATFAVNHYLASGDVELSSDPDRPEDGAIWNLGWNPTDEQVLYDYMGSGVWVAWYAAEPIGDTLELTWETTVGVALDDTTA